jgi:hypothetical protein
MGIWSFENAGLSSGQIVREAEELGMTTVARFLYAIIWFTAFWKRMSVAWPQVRTASQLYSRPADAEFLSTLGRPEQPECAARDVKDKYGLPSRYRFILPVIPDLNSTQRRSR